MMKKSNANTKTENRPLNKAEQRLYNSLKKSFKEIKLHQEGEDWTSPDFDREAKRLSKKHKGIKQDLAKLIDELEIIP